MGGDIGHNGARHWQMKGILGRGSLARPGSSWRFGVGQFVENICNVSRGFL